MIVIAGSIAVRPEKRAEARATALEMARATQSEAGCISYRFFADLADENSFFIFEEWESEEALARHFATPHMASFQAKIAGLVAGAPAIRRYEVQSVGPLARPE